MENSGKLLPALRQDLRLHQGAPSLNGQPTWLIYDPVRHRYFSVSERVYQMVNLWSQITAKEFATYASDILDAHIDVEEIDDILFFLHSNNLTDAPPDDDPFSYARQTEASRKNIFSKALHSYLFFRIPVWRSGCALDIGHPL